MKRISFAFVVALMATSAHAAIPFFNATCPQGIEIHADQGGPIFIDGREANLKIFNDNYYEAYKGGFTLSLSINPDGTPSVSYTSDKGHGVCNIKNDDSSHSSGHSSSHHDSYDRDEGVTLYHDYNFRGGSEVVYRDIPDMARTEIGNDSLSSIRVPRGCRVTLYADNNYRGRSLDLYGDEDELGRTEVGNDSVSSMRVDCDDDGGHGYGHSDSEGVTLYRDYDFRGGSEKVYGDIPDMARTPIGNDSLSSIEVPRGCRVTLYADNNYRGRSVELYHDESELGHTDVGNDSVSSIRVNCD